MRDLLQHSFENEARLLSSTREFESIVEKLADLDYIDGIGNQSFVNRLIKSQFALNEEVAKIMLTRFGLPKLTLDNIEEVYNPQVSGHGSMAETRAFLLQRGMNAELADLLARRYINKLESSSKIYTVMDFFDSHKDASANNDLQAAPLSQVHFSY